MEKNIKKQIKNGAGKRILLILLLIDQIMLALFILTLMVAGRYLQNHKLLIHTMGLMLCIVILLPIIGYLYAYFSKRQQKKYILSMIDDHSVLIKYKNDSIEYFSNFIDDLTAKNTQSLEELKSSTDFDDYIKNMIDHGKSVIKKIQASYNSYAPIDKKVYIDMGILKDKIIKSIEEEIMNSISRAKRVKQNYHLSIDKDIQKLSEKNQLILEEYTKKLKEEIIDSKKELEKWENILKTY